MIRYPEWLSEFRARALPRTDAPKRGFAQYESGASGNSG